MTSSIFSQLKAVRTAQGCEDPAIDMNKTELLKYLQSRDVSDLVLLDGMQPDLFVLDRLSTQTMLALSNRSTSSDLMAVTAFLAGCHRVELSDGTVLQPSEYLPGNAAKVAADSWIATVAEEVGFPVVLEMGRLVLKLSSLGKRNKVSFF